MKFSEKISSLLLVGPGFFGGGAEGQFALMHRLFFAGSLPVALLTGDRRDVTPDDVSRVYFLGWRRGLSYFRIIPHFWWLVFRGGYRIIFAFGLFPCLLAACATMGRQHKPLIIVSEITRPRKADERADGSLRRWGYPMLRRWCYRRADLLTANSIDGLREMREIAGVGPEEGARVPNVVDHEALRAMAGSASEYPLPTFRYVLCSSRFERMKRLDTAIEAIALLREMDIHLVIVGGGPERGNLVALTNKMSLSARIHFIGWLKNPAPLMKQAVALVLASEYEGFSNSVLEAMFLDTPVITSICSADAEEMCERGAALGFPVGDERTLAANIRRLVDEPSVSELLVKQARLYRQPHARENAIPAYEQLFLQYLEKT